MRKIVRVGTGIVVLAHGLVHLLGAMVGFGFGEIAGLVVSSGAAVGWLAAAVVVTTAGVLQLSGVRWWWQVGAVGVVVSQLMVLSAWQDAKAGSAANLIMALAVLHGFAAEGPMSLRAAYRRALTNEASVATAAVPVTEADLAHLPPPVAAYVASSGAVGQPHVEGFRARIHGRIRAAADKPWMRYVGEQRNRYGAEPSRVFYLDATMFGLPVDVLHTYIGSSARMQVRLCSVIPMVDMSGPEMTQAETVTLLNDLCVMAPAALVDAPIRWTSIDRRRARADYANAGHHVSAELIADDEGRLVDFISDDRLRAAPDGKTLIAQRWSTPISDYRDFGRRRLGATGIGRWLGDDDDPGDSFDYLEFHLDDVSFDHGRISEPSQRGPVRRGLGGPRYRLRPSRELSPQSGRRGESGSTPSESLGRSAR